MKFRTQKITALMAAAVLGISAFGSVPVTAAESTETADPGAAMMVDGEAVSSDLVAGTFKPSDVTCKAQDSYVPLNSIILIYTELMHWYNPVLPALTEIGIAADPYRTYFHSCIFLN